MAVTLPIAFVPAGTGEFGLRATTSERSAAIAAVLAALTETGPCVPSVISIGHEFAVVFGVPWFAVTVLDELLVPPPTATSVTLIVTAALPDEIVAPMT
jgi:hypothetical protein